MMQNTPSTAEYWQSRLGQETQTSAVSAQFKSGGWKKRASQAQAHGRSASANHGGFGDKGHAAAVHDEGTWIFSYADMITILMMFFILLLSISNVSPQKFKALQESIQKLDKNLNIAKVQEKEEKKENSKKDNKTKEQKETKEIDLEKLKAMLPTDAQNHEEQTLKAAAYLLSSISESAIEKGTEELEVFEDLKSKIKNYSQKISKLKITKNTVLIKASVPLDMIFDENLKQISSKGSLFLKNLVENLQPNIGKVNIQLGIHLSKFSVAEQNRFVPRSPADAQALSIELATKVFQAFVQNGLSADRLSASGYGFYKPLFAEQNNQGLVRRALVQGNNRIEMIVERRAGDSL